MLKLSEIMKLDIMKEAKILAGEKNIGNEVRSVSVLEIPEATPFIKKSELLISAFYSISTDIEKQIAVVKMLKNIGASGLILSHVGFVLNGVSDKLIDTCERIEFPLVLAPVNLAYIDIISPILDTLLYNHNNKLKQTLKIYDIMSETIIDKQDPTSILHTLYDLIKRPIYYFDYNLDSALQMGINKKNFLSKEFMVKEISNNLESLLNRKDVCISQENSKSKWLLTPIISNVKYYGVLVICITEQLSDLDWIAINQTKNSISVVTLNNINRKDYKMSVKKEFIIDLLSKEPSKENIVIKRGLGLGYDITLLRMVIVIDIYNFNLISKDKPESYLIQFKKDILQTVKNSISMKADEYIVIDYSDKIILLLYEDVNEKTTKSKAFKISNYLVEQIESKNEVQASVGIGNYYEDFKYIYKSYEEAQMAIKISNKLHSRPKCTPYNEIKIYHALFKDIDQNWVKEIIDEMFGELIIYDELNDSELLYTLITLIDNDINIKMTSERLFLHRNTIIQRKNKIIDILGIDPFTYPNLTKYSIATLLYKFFYN